MSKHCGEVRKYAVFLFKKDAEKMYVYESPTIVYLQLESFVSLLSYRYDPDSNQWVSLCPMNSRRLGVGLAVCGGCLYAIGGSDGTAPLATAER